MKKSRLQRKVAELPQNPGVYFFRDQEGKILYIGKATNLRSRVQSYFRNVIPNSFQDLDEPSEMLKQVQHDTKGFLSVPGRSEWIGLMVAQVVDIDFEQTDSVLEALILESNLIKKYQPKYNTLEKDDKSFSYFVVTKEEFPKVLIVRKTDLVCHPALDAGSSHTHKSGSALDSRLRGNDKASKPCKKIQNTKYQIPYTKTFGPYTSKQQMQTALKIIRRIFPFHAGKQKTEKGCLDFQIGLCPGPYADAISKTDYKKNIRGIEMILQGKKKSLISKMEKEMQVFSKKNEFEKAAVLRNKIFALQHIRDVALMTREMEHGAWNMEHEIQDTKYQIPNTRIEAYDISNISGQYAVGSMVVFENGMPNKSQYRKFKIKTVDGSNDVAMMKEVLSRRFNNDWSMPDLILLDGGQGHVNMAGDLVRELGLDLLIVGVAKGKTRKNLNFQFPISNKISN